jgi:hypothetical protein
VVADGEVPVVTRMLEQGLHRLMRVGPRAGHTESKTYRFPWMHSALKTKVCSGTSANLLSHYQATFVNSPTWQASVAVGYSVWTVERNDRALSVELAEMNENSRQRSI